MYAAFLNSPRRHGALLKCSPRVTANGINRFAIYMQPNTVCKMISRSDIFQALCRVGNGKQQKRRVAVVNKTMNPSGDLTRDAQLTHQFPAFHFHKITRNHLANIQLPDF